MLLHFLFFGRNTYNYYWLFLKAKFWFLFEIVNKWKFFKYRITFNNPTLPADSCFKFYPGYRKVKHLLIFLIITIFSDDNLDIWIQWNVFPLYASTFFIFYGNFIIRIQLYLFYKWFTLIKSKPFLLTTPFIRPWCAEFNSLLAINNLRCPHFGAEVTRKWNWSIYLWCEPRC